MGTRAERTDPALWEKVKRSITRGGKGGRPGEWSARKAQMAVQEYKRRGGGYRGPKRPDNSLVEWTEEDWGTRSGRNSTETGERYLPRKARDALTPEEYRATTRKKRRDTSQGRQFSRQPAAVARKVAPYRHHIGGERGASATGWSAAKSSGKAGRSRKAGGAKAGRGARTTDGQHGRR